MQLARSANLHLRVVNLTHTPVERMTNVTPNQIWNTFRKVRIKDWDARPN
tara:strand:- start:700 stop:849 length:150 start_codon:yes stop_codon:yes gene_type:complete